MTALLTIGEGRLAARVGLAGGTLRDATFDGVPFLRPGLASFPLVPFGNRVAGNEFAFNGRTYRLAANTDRDPLYLHGDGWLGEWAAGTATASHVDLAFDHPVVEGAPYGYRAVQSVGVEDGALVLRLAVENTGAEPMPFGLGHHLFLPLTAGTTLKAAASSYWTEKAGFLPDALRPRPDTLNFDTPRRLPGHWINNGFEDWDGHAEIAWPEAGVALAITADAAFGRYVVFLSDPSYEPGFAGDHFCFEPMTHAVDAHHRPDLGGLVVLAPGDRLATTLRLTPRRLAAPATIVPERHRA